MPLVRSQRSSVFRKVALSAWRQPGDPSVYGFVELDVTDLSAELSPLALVLKALAETMSRHPEMNSTLRRGRIYYRENIAISVMVNMPSEDRHDLSVAFLDHVDKMSLTQIREAITQKAQQIRKKKDPHLGVAMTLVRILPQFLIRWLLSLYISLTQDLGLSLSFLGLPSAPFGSVIVSNLGAFGIQRALLPLVPLTRSALMISLGERTKEARVINDQIVIREVLQLGVTFDHRFFDGSHAARMLQDFKASFAQQISPAENV